MNKNLTYVLIHSPLVGPLTWQLVSQEMQQHGLDVITPTLTDQPNSGPPYWQHHAEAIAKTIAQIPAQRRLVLVAHSGAGPLLPIISQTARRTPAAYLFVDAGIPRPGLSRLELMKHEDRSWADQFQQSLLQGARLPLWTEQDLRDEIPDDKLRQQMVAEINPRALPFFTEPIPVFAAWPDAPCAYVKLSAAYDWDFKQSQQAGWLVRSLDAGHFHMLVDPTGIAEMIMEAVQEMADQ